MDPNAALATIRKLTAKGQSRLGYSEIEELLDAIEALDGWLSQGGFLPDGWAEGRTR